MAERGSLTPISEAEYEPIEAAVMETARGRSFLSEFARRNRTADTTILLDAINIKLDKAGGLTEALALARAAEERGLAIMVGCMVGTSLAMAPAMLLAPRARFVDLDGPLLLARDRDNGLLYDGSLVQPPSPSLWG